MLKDGYTPRKVRLVRLPRRPISLTIISYDLPKIFQPPAIHLADDVDRSDDGDFITGRTAGTECEFKRIEARL